MRETRLLLLGVAALTASRLALAANVGLGDAEAYYWTWSRALAWSYYDHGPVVAWLIRAGTTLLGEQSTLAVRLPFIAISAATMLLLAASARTSGPRAGLVAVAALSAMPMFFAAGAAANPDVPLLFCLALVLYASLRDLRDPGRGGWLLLAGIGAGLATSCKLTGALCALPLFHFALRAPAAQAAPGGAMVRGARRARRLAAVALPLALGALPVLVWNAARGWPMLRYHLIERHTSAPGPSALNLAKLVGGQLAYVSPLLLLALLAVLWPLARSWRGSAAARRLLLLSLSLLVPGYLLILAVPSAEPHWPAVGYLPLLVPLATALPRWWRRWRAVRVLAVCGAIYSAALFCAFHVHLLTDWGVRLVPERHYVARHDLANELLGWSAVARAVSAELARDPVPAAAAACHYTSCAQLRFAARGRFEVLCPSPRRDQFDFFRGGDGATRRGLDLLYVEDPRFPFAVESLYRCRAVEALQRVTVRRGGRVVRRFALQRCRGFGGLATDRWPPRRAADRRAAAEIGTPPQTW